jgi:NADH-quinone oxidoreductase subunit D
MATTKRTVEVALSTNGLGPDGRPQRVPLVVDDRGQAVAMEAAPALEPDLEGEHMLINIGPQHPATHGVLRLVLELDGETVVRCVPHIGYLHCGLREDGRVPAVQPDHPLDRPRGLPQLAGEQRRVRARRRAAVRHRVHAAGTVLRVIVMELSRIISHLVWMGTTAVDIGAFTPFLWTFQERENVYNLLEGWVGRASPRR